MGRLFTSYVGGEIPLSPRLHDCVVNGVTEDTVRAEGQCFFQVGMEFFYLPECQGVRIRCPEAACRDTSKVFFFSITQPTRSHIRPAPDLQLHGHVRETGDRLLWTLVPRFLYPTALERDKQVDILCIHVAPDLAPGVCGFELAGVMHDIVL